MGKCANWTIDCYQGKKCEGCNEYLSHEDRDKFWEEKNILSKQYDKERAKFLKKYWLLEFVKEYKDYTKEQLLNELVKIRLLRKGYFIQPYPSFNDYEPYKLLKTKYPTAKW